MLESLISTIESHNDCVIRCDESFHTIWLHDEAYDNEFRYTILADRIIVSRICFQNKRNGCMTACFELLREFSDQESFSIIEIQSVLTYSMMMWCLKNDFEPSRDCMTFVDEDGHSIITGDYARKVII